MDIFTRSALFGEAVTFRSESYPVAAEAVTDCCLIHIEAGAFRDFWELTQSRVWTSVTGPSQSRGFVHARLAAGVRF